MRAVAIIPARAGSTRIPGKNLKSFHGRPILCYAIETALQSGLFSAGVYVSTEDPATAHVAWAAGAKVHPRQKALAENDVGTQQVMQVALRELYPGPFGLPDHPRPPIACCIYATTPLMSREDLMRGYQMLRSSLSVAYAYSVGPDGKDAGQFYWGLTEAFIDGRELDEGNLTAHLPIAKERVCDINTMDDWIRAERMYANLYLKDGPT